jgi:hypothetical protein
MHATTVDCHSNVLGTVEIPAPLHLYDLLSLPKEQLALPLVPTTLRFVSWNNTHNNALKAKGPPYSR